MNDGRENEILFAMQELVRELVNTCQDLELLDLIYKMLLLR